jgi:hypothetical protein
MAWVLAGSPSIVTSQSAQRSSHPAALAATIASNPVSRAASSPRGSPAWTSSPPSTSRDVPMRTSLSSRTGPPGNVARQTTRSSSTVKPLRSGSTDGSVATA